MLVSFPFKILVEKSVKINETLSGMSLGNSCAILCDSDVKKIAGDKARDELSSSFSADLLIPESLEKNYLEGLAKKISRYDFIIGMGGGRVIDITKYAAHIADIEWVSFPTILSQDGIVSSIAVVNQGKKKLSVNTRGPVAVIADLNIIKRAPYRYIAAGAGEMVSNISAVKDWQIADEAGREKFNSVAAKLSLLAAESVVENTKNIKNKDAYGLETLFWSLMLSGISKNIYGSSRTTSGSEHQFAHSLEELGSTALHGEQVALGTIVSIFLQNGEWLKIRSVFEKLALPTTAKQAGISNDMAIEALLLAPKMSDRYTVLDKHDISRKQAENILQKVGII